METLGIEVHMSSGDVVKLVLGVITFCGVCVTAYYSFRGQREARGANRAVNGNAEGTIRLYDLAVNHQRDLDNLSAWMKSYQGGPLDEGHKVVEFVENTEQNFCLLHREIKDVDAELKKLDAKIDRHACPYSKESSRPECEGPDDAES